MLPSHQAVGLDYTILFNPVENVRPWKLGTVDESSGLGTQLLLYTVELPGTARIGHLTAAEHRYRTADACLGGTHNNCLETSVILVYVVAKRDRNSIASVNQK